MRSFLDLGFELPQLLQLMNEHSLVNIRRSTARAAELPCAGKSLPALLCGKPVSAAAARLLPAHLRPWFSFSRASSSRLKYFSAS